MKIQLTRATVYNNNGDTGEVGQIVETDDRNARFLIAIKKAVKYETLPSEPKPVDEEPVVDEIAQDPSKAADEDASPKRRKEKAADKDAKKED